jgi:predicted component of type VI protein secretion system
MIHSLNQLFVALSQSPPQTNIKLCTNPSLAFPSSDVRASSNNVYTLNLLGLMGVDSPLPHYMNTLAAQEGNAAWSDLLNIINHYLYRLAYLSWKQGQPLLSLTEASSDYIRCLQSLSGGILRKTDWKLLSYTQYYIRRTRSAYDFIQIIRELLPDISVVLIKQTLTWKRVKTSSTPRLSESALLGDRVLTAGEAITVQLYFSQTTWEQWQHADILQSFIRSFVPHEISVTLDAVVSINQKKIPMLGMKEIMLGRTHLVGIAEKRVHIPNAVRI